MDMNKYKLQVKSVYEELLFRVRKFQDNCPVVIVEEERKKQTAL